MDKWDPQREDFESDFNSYDRGPGQHFNRKMDFSDGVKLYVTGIPNEITEEGLHNMFSQCGNCLSVKKCISKQADAGDTYGFVIMKTQTDAITAIASYNNHAINRFKMRVQVALDEETMKRHKQKKLEEEMFYQNLPSVKAEQKMKQQMQSKPLRAITRTIENGHQSDTDSSSDGRYRKTKKGPGSVMNGHEDSSIPGLQHISDDTLEIDPSVLHYQVSPRSRGALGRGYFNEDPYYSDHNYRPGRGRGFYGNTYQDMNNGYGGGYGRGMSTHDSWGYHHGRGGFLNDYRDRQYRPRPNNPDYPFDDDYGGYATDYDGYQGGYRRGHFDGHRARGRRGNQGYPGDFGRGRGFGPVRRRGSTESLLSVGGPKKPVMEVEARPCLLCGKPGQYQCGRCKGPYCTPACQKSHWSTHKKECGQKKKEIEDDDDGGFEVSIGNDIVQQTKSLVEKHTGEEMKVTKKPKQEINQPNHSEPKARPAQQPSLDYSQGVKPKTTQPITPANNTRAKEQISPVTPPQAKQYVNGVNSSAAVTETRGATCTFNTTLSLNEQTDVLVSEVVNPGEIWVQLLTQEFQEVEPLRERMTKVYQSSTGNVVKPRIGDMYAGMFSLDNNWYRARVDAVEGDKLSVTYMDYGNKETVSCSKLRQLQQDMLQLPLQAIECCLKDMKPLEGDSWGRGAEDVLKIVCPPTTMCSKLYRATAHSVTGSKYTVSLEDMDGEDIGEKLIKSKTVSCTKDNEEEVTCSAAAAAAAATVGEPTAAAVSALPYSTLPLQENSLVLVTEVVSPDEIWVQQADQAIIDRGNQVTAAIFEKMRGKEIPPATNACVGNLYAAPFSGSFYRARLDAFVQQDRVEVTYVEFGNKEIVSLCELFELTSELKSVPFSVVHCCLDGIVPCSGTNWNREAVLKLQELLQKSEESGEFYEAFCIESAGHLLKVKLVNRTVKDKDIAAKLVEAGVAKYGNRNTPVYPPVSGVSPSAAGGENQAAAAVSIPAEAKPAATGPTDASSLAYSKFTVKQKTAVLVQEVESPDEIWVQEALEEVVLSGKAVTTDINLKIINENKLPQAVNACVGNLYAAMFEKFWYRARLDSFEDSETVNVTYVEFGNKGTVKLSELKELEPDQKVVPFSVVHCFLDGIVPVSGSDWSHEAIQTLKEITPCAGVYEVFCNEGLGHLMKVKLFNDKGEDIAEKLVQKGVARPGKRDPPVYPPVPNARQVKPRPLVLAKSLGCVMDNMQMNQKLENLNIIDFKSPALFVVQIVAEKLVRDYKQIAEELDTVCVAAEPTEYRPEQVGQLVVGKFEGQWYRAEVIEMKESSVKVRYIDFGNEALNDFSTIQQATELCTTIPAQACFCGLADVSVPHSGEWPPNVLQKFFELASMMEPKPLEAVYKGSVDGISMIDIMDCKEGKSIAAVLSQELSGAKPKSPAAKSPVAQPQQQVKTLIKACDVPMESLPLNGTRVKAGIIDITSFDLFFLHLAERQDDLDKLKQHLATYCELDTPHNPVAGELVCAKFSLDKVWYRAEVLKVTEDNLYQVMFVDWGNCETVSSHSIREIHASLATLPKQAIHCRLKGVKHDDQIEESFIEFVSCVNKILLEVQADTFENNIYSVTVIGDEGFNFNEHFGVKGKKPEVQAPEKLLSPFPQPAGASVKFAIGGKHPPENEEFFVAVTHIESPHEFYCQFADNEALHNLVLLMQNMMMYCEMEAVNPAFSPVVGDLCCAMFTDSQWYRGEILKVFPDKSFQVKYFDFGNKEVISGEQIREMKSEYLELPKLAFKCSLTDVMPAEGQSWDSAPKEKMQKLSDNKVLTAKCVGRSEDDAYLLELWHKDETRNINFAEILKSNGLARSAAPPPPPARNGEAVDKETMLLEQIAALQAQLMSLKTNK